MAIFMTCPSCNRPGNLPDSFRGGRVTCPGCGTITMIPGPKSAPQSSSPEPAAPRPPARPKPPAPKPQPVPSYLDDDDDDEPLIAPEPTRPSTTRTSAARGRAPEPAKSNLPIILGVGGGGAILAAVVVVLIVINRPAGGPAEVPDRFVAGNNGGQPAVDPPPPVVNNPVTAPASSVTPPAPSYTPSNESTADLIKRIKDATVFIKVKTPKAQGSGSGFVIRTEGSTVLVATNRHVISHHDSDDDEGEAPPTPTGSQPEPIITVVFRSGEGAGQEQELPVKVLAKDSSGDTSRDLAILQVQNVTRPPRPIELNRSGQPTEGMPLRIYGFPFGQMLNMGTRGNPAITVNAASVSSLRRDDLGQLSLIQLDGSVQPGNSGGPVVDEHGRLIGVAVAKLRMADGIGLAIPTANLDAILNGWVGSFALERVADASGGMALQASVELVDPNGKLRSVEMLIAPLSGPPPKPNESAVAVSLMQNARPHPLTISQPTKTAAARINPGLAGTPQVVLVQVRFTGGDGRTYTSSPRAYRLPNAAGRLVALGERNEEALNKIRKTIDKLGPLQDPDKDCQLAKDAKGVTITIPGKLHALSPQIVDKKNVAVKNAPMTLAKVKGDFLVHVLVDGQMMPGTEAVKDPKTGKALPITFQGAGIVLWKDKDNYVRLERTCGTAGGSTLVTRLLVEVCERGKESGRPYYINVAEGPVSLMMIRKDGAIRCLFSNDGREWKIFKPLAAVFPDDIQVGLHGVNLSKQPLKAQFKEFALIEDKDEIAKEFNDQ